MGPSTSFAKATSPRPQTASLALSLSATTSPASASTKTATSSNSTLSSIHPFIHPSLGTAGSLRFNSRPGNLVHLNTVHVAENRDLLDPVAVAGAELVLDLVEESVVGLLVAEGKLVVLGVK